MAKTLISEQQLKDEINVELRRGWSHNDSHCEVSGLKRVSLPERNWEVTMSNTG